MAKVELPSTGTGNMAGYLAACPMYSAICGVPVVNNASGAA